MKRLYVSGIILGIALIGGCGGTEEISLDSQTEASDEAVETNEEVEPEVAPDPAETLAPAGPTDGDLRVIRGYWEMYPAFARDEYCRIWRVEKVTDTARTDFASGFAEPMAEPDYKLIRPDEVDAFGGYWQVFLDEECL